jgi:hypothetical protein
MDMVCLCLKSWAPAGGEREPVIYTLHLNKLKLKKEELCQKLKLSLKEIILLV